MKDLYPLLSEIVQPADLHRYATKELVEIAAELRRAIVENVSRTGGHFSSNLGTVELAVALYATYSTPPDKVVWDTGHQAYPHKMLTGRLEKFHTLRHRGGISGFLRRSEHPLDAFGAGHAGTAVSAALGFAVARDRLGTGERVVALTGDAAISSGMSWEAMNHVADLHTDVTVVLNDNRMSISPNVGAMKNYLSRLRSRPNLQSLAQRAKHVAERMPDPMQRVAAGLRHGITHYLAPEPTGTLFEEMGWEYIGPIDGHDLPLLVDVFRNVRALRGPVLVHAITVKGKGYEVAEEDSRKWHGVSPFDAELGELSGKAGKVSFTQAFGDAITECAKADEKVVAVTAAMTDGTGLSGFATAYPERFYDVGIAEQHAVTFAAGMAAGGLKPCCAIYSTFLQRAFDQVAHDVCLQNLPVRFFVDRAGLVGEDGPTHHGAFDLSYLGCLPNLVVMAPRDTTELREMVRFAVAFAGGPCAVRYPRGAAGDGLPEGRTPIALGRAEVMRTGRDLLLVAIGSMVGVAHEAALALEAEGVSCGVINARFMKPLDVETIAEAARKARAVVTIEENARIGGFGSLVADALREADVERVVEILSLPDAFVEHGSQAELLRDCGLDVSGVCETARKALDLSEHFRLLRD